MTYNPKIHHRRSIRLKGYDYSQAGLYFITICCNRWNNSLGLPFGNIENGEMILNEFGQIAYNEWVKLTERFTNFELDVFQIMPNHMHGIIALSDSVRAGFTPAQNITITPAHIGDDAQNGGDAQNDANAQNDGNTQNDDPQTITPAQDGANVQNDANIIQGAGASPAPTGNASVSDIVGAYKSLVANGCLDIWKLAWVGAGFTPAQIPTMGKLWQRDFYEHIIRNEQSYETISNYIINNPAKWNEDKFYAQAGLHPTPKNNKK